MIFTPRRAEAYQAGARVHPNIDPLRVVGLAGPRMTRDLKPYSTWQQQDELVVWDTVHENMDSMALVLAEESSVPEAWRSIFVRPPGKSWADAVVAIKTNQVGQMRTSAAVMSKVCRVLTDVIGVKASNVHIYDGCDGGGSRQQANSISREGHFTGLPEGIHLADLWGGCRGFRTKVPVPYMDGRQECGCLPHLVAGRVDILVDIAVPKVNGRQFGGFTMCMKNHFGTFDPMPSHREGGGTDYLTAINMTPEILGPMDPKTGNVLYPRQQLCIIDALWASRGIAVELPDAQPNALLMGVFAPSLDHLVAKRLLKDELHWAVNDEATDRLLTDFGYDPVDLPNGGRIVNALAGAGDRAAVTL